MTNDETLRQFDLDQSIGDLFRQAGLEGEPSLLIAIDVNGVPVAFAAPGRKMRRIEEGTPSPATQVIRLEHASWVVYQQNPTRKRTRIGGTSWDG